MDSDACAKKIEELRTNAGLKSDLPDLPVAIVLHEALNLYDWCQHDREILTKTGLDWKLAEDIPLRAEALSRLESVWTSERLSIKEGRKEWKVALPQALRLRKVLVHHFYYAFSSNPDAYSKVQRIAKGQEHADMIQDLADLSVLGKKYQSELKSLGIDLGILDKAMQMSFELGGLLASANYAVHESSENQKLRNKAYYHLKESIEAVRKVGKYVFWEDKERYKGYISAFAQRKNQKYRNKKT